MTPPTWGRTGSPSPRAGCRTWAATTAGRATQIWTWAPGATAPEPVTANRNNDRWPVLIAGEQILFSLWSRNREAVTADLAEVQPVSMGGDFATRPTDHWMAAVVMTNAAQFGYAVKAVEPVWRPRPLFNGRIAFMTAPTPDSPMRLAQADWGYIRTSPSSLADGETLPYEGGAQRYFGPDRDAEGRALDRRLPVRLARPLGPLRRIAGRLAAGVVRDLRGLRRLGRRPARAPTALRRPRPGRRGAGGDLSTPVRPRAQAADAPRRRATTPGPRSIRLASGATYAGPMGYLENVAMAAAIRNPIPWHDRSGGKQVDPRANPLVSPPPNVASIAVYSAGRDRFDDPDQLRVPGSWESSWCCPWSAAMTSGPGSPATRSGRRSSSAWTPRARSPDGPARRRAIARRGPISPTRATTTAAIRPNGYHYCNGCHTGHTFTQIDAKERAGDSALERFFGK